MSSYLKDKLDLKLDFSPRRTQSASALTDRPVNGHTQSPKEQRAADDRTVKSAEKVHVFLFLYDIIEPPRGKTNNLHRRK